MKNLNLEFVKNKAFIYGLISGLLLSALTTIVILSINEPTPDKTKLKGVIVEGWVPKPGEMGMVVFRGKGSKCPESEIVGVQFDNDPSQGVVICKPMGADNAARVKIVMITNSPDCQKDGIWVTRVNL